MTPYLPFGAPPPSGVRLFCLPHAGGAASAFTGWQRELGPKVAALPVQLPGRERRTGEARFTDLDALTADLDAHLDPYLEGEPFAFYGHSMGAIVAYALTRRRAERGARLPFRLFVGAYPPPHRPAPITWALELSDDDLARWLVDIGGMSETLLRYPDWVRPALALVRDDLRVCESHRPPPQDVKLPVPIEVFAGADDPLLPVQVTGGWALHTSVGCRVHVLPGGHFFANDPASGFLRELADTLFPL